MDDSMVRLQLTGDFEITIGSGPGSQVVLPIAASVNARLRRSGDRLFLKTARTDTARTLINHTPIKADRWTEVTRYDEIATANTVLSICGLESWARLKWACSFRAAGFMSGEENSKWI